MPIRRVVVERERLSAEASRLARAGYRCEVEGDRAVCWRQLNDIAYLFVVLEVEKP